MGFWHPASVLEVLSWFTEFYPIFKLPLAMADSRVSAYKPPSYLVARLFLTADQIIPEFEGGLPFPLLQYRAS